MMRKLAASLPLVLTFALIFIFGAVLLSGRNAQTIPSARLNQSVPSFSAPKLGGPPAPHLLSPPLLSTDLTPARGTVTLLNVWASWCTPCLAEHPYLMALAAQDHIKIIGLNYKDKPQAAQAFLAKHGNPYTQIGVDQDGTIAIELGVYGVPETYLIDDKGIIRHKVVGPITPDLITTQLGPLIEQIIAD